MTDIDYLAFRTIILDYYQANGRHDMPWRIPETDGNFDPYKIMVSELMLQQTQVSRVVPKYLQFLILFPTVADLARATLADVLKVWSGLGYNRRAKFMHQAAQMIAGDLQGVFPRSVDELVRLPGVGKNTAGAIMAYAYNQPVLFIETNIRTVYIHHFFHDQTDIPDSAIAEALSKTLDKDNPREFYWALMDYGAYLKQTVGNLNKLSKGYAKQSPFQGSLRQIRGQVIKSLTLQPQDLAGLQTQISDERLLLVLDDLIHEGMIIKIDESYRLA